MTGEEYVRSVAEDGYKLTCERLAAENERLCKTLNTAYLMVKVDASDAPGRISMAIRPFLEAATKGVA